MFYKMTNVKEEPILCAGFQKPIHPMEHYYDYEGKCICSTDSGG